MLQTINKILTRSAKTRQEQTGSNKINQRNAKHKPASAACENASQNAGP